MLKRMTSLILALTLCLGFALAEGGEDSRTYEGVWVYERYSLIMERLEEGFSATIYCPADPDDITQWIYPTITINEADGTLAAAEGVRTHILYGDDGAVAEAEEAYNDGEATFALTDDDHLVWTDLKEVEPDNTITFERGVDIPLTPSAEAIEADYMRPLLTLETGSAGSSLKTAQAVVDAAQFAMTWEMWNVDETSLELTLQSSFDTLSEDEQAAFAANFSVVSTLGNQALSDWDNQQGLFDDAGAAADMEAVVFDPLNRLAFTNLCDATKAALKIED